MDDVKISSEIAIPSSELGSRGPVEIEPGLTYVGQWRGNVREGKGILYWSSGKMFEVEFENNRVVAHNPKTFYARKVDEQKSFPPGDLVSVVSESIFEYLVLVNGSLKWVDKGLLTEPLLNPDTVTALMDEPEGRFLAGTKFQSLSLDEDNQQILIKDFTNETARPFWTKREFFIAKAVQDSEIEIKHDISLGSNITYSGPWNKGGPHGRGKLFFGEGDSFEALFENGNLKIDENAESSIFTRYYALSDDVDWKSGDCISVVGQSSLGKFLLRVLHRGGQTHYQFVQDARFAKEKILKLRAIFDDVYQRFRMGDVVDCFAQTDDKLRVLISTVNNPKAFWWWSRLFIGVGEEFDPEEFRPRTYVEPPTHKPVVSQGGIPSRYSDKPVVSQDGIPSRYADNFSIGRENDVSVQYYGSVSEERIRNLGLEHKQQEYQDGMSYVGYWKGSQRQGDGQLRWPDGDRFEGRFHEDQVVIRDDGIFEPCYFVDESTHAEFKSGELVYVVAYSEKKSKCLCLGSNTWISASKLVAAGKEPYQMKTSRNDELGRFKAWHVVTVLVQSNDGLSSLIDINQQGVGPFWLANFLLDPIDAPEKKSVAKIVDPPSGDDSDDEWPKEDVDQNEWDDAVNGRDFKYHGNFDDQGRMHGVGTLVWGAEEDKYEGTFTNGIPDIPNGEMAFYFALKNDPSGRKLFLSGQRVQAMLFSIAETRMLCLIKGDFHWLKTSDFVEDTEQKKTRWHARKDHPNGCFQKGDVLTVRILTEDGLLALVERPAISVDLWVARELLEPLEAGDFVPGQEESPQ
eukprot:TRINITY_DN2495_c0_g1_i2.p1 TRINITY_DN2495_c0_g1~~TRINITY_DN2495_c0_g1_i2.p1  ORF type:complete len:821 (-),score=175.48 TRINITY_DN2495_c0_g1_i2:137-2530(-)